MRFLPMALALLLTLATLVAAAPRETPYRAYVTADDVYVRSGPAKSPYYPTAKLKKGDVVEVYRHDPGGWCAIRPPEGSYSWVSARYLSLEGDGLARVTGDMVAARVGSAFSDIRDVIQVRLDKGELVEVLGKKEMGPGPGDATWYKIAPPSGEFRWVSGRYLDADYLTSGVGAASTNSPLMGSSRPASGEPRHLPGSDAPAQQTAEPLSTTQRATWIESGPANGRDVIQTAGTEPGTYRSPRLPELQSESTSTSEPTSPFDFQTEMDNINLELSIMLAEEASVWHFDELRLRANALLVHAETAVQRGRARQLVDRIATSEDIKQRYNDTGAYVAETERRNRQLRQIAESQEVANESNTDRWSQTSADSTIGARYDAAGRLARVKSDRLGVPRYALLNEQGEVLCYVNPAPGVNMDYHLGRYIGVTGIRGYYSEQDANLVTAKHVAPVAQSTTR